MSSLIPADPPPNPGMSLAEFFESVPVLEQRDVAVVVKHTRGSTSSYLVFPPIQLFCSDPKCRRIGSFDDSSPDSVHVSFTGGTMVRRAFVTYRCRNCLAHFKVYAVQMLLTETPTEQGFVITARFAKLGENPRFGEPRPDMVTQVLDDEIEYFDRGYRSEREGLGIGAFAYYRRFVDSHKDKILDRIRAVAVAQNAGPEVIEALDRAKKTNSFERAVGEIKDAIPQGLRLKGGHNPLTVLYRALSIGVHEDDDADCLERAQDIRTVLTALAEKTNQALADSKELDAAVSRLLKRP
jgi:hypothetical protein